MFVTENQFFIFISCVAFGGVSGVAFTVFDCFKFFLKNPIFRIFPDAVAFLAVTVGYVFYSYYLRFPDFRIYMPIGVLVGIFLYMKSLRLLLAYLLKTVYNKLRVNMEKRYDKFKTNKADYRVNHRRGGFVSLSHNNLSLSNDSDRRGKTASSTIKSNNP